MGKGLAAGCPSQESHPRFDPSGLANSLPITPSPDFQIFPTPLMAVVKNIIEQTLWNVFSQTAVHYFNLMVSAFNSLFYFVCGYCIVLLAAWRNKR